MKSSMYNIQKKRYVIHRGSLHDRFFKSRAKIQIVAGGFANGKTAAICIRAISIGKDYPGANILMARSTYPKLNDTLRKEFLKWCPKHFIAARGINKGDNTVTFKNGTVFNFRYIAQQGRNNESSTSNLLSATFDAIFVDQIEDPEIIEKDFDDLMGRLRGMAKYNGNDPTMPTTGPRWFTITLNPTRNWAYKKLIKPMHLYNQGLHSPDLLVNPKDGKPLIELFEGSTYENKDNLEEDFIEALEATYKGQMRSRFLLGEWGAYEGLVHPQFDESIHVLSHNTILQHLQTMRDMSYRPNILEGYDDGLAAPSCYILAFTDNKANIFLVDGGYYTGEENRIDIIAKDIKDKRQLYGFNPTKPIYADPAIFRRGRTSSKLVGQSVSSMYAEQGIQMQRGNNDIQNGIKKINGYLSSHNFHEHPIFGHTPAPYLYVSDKLQFFIDEINEYYWRKNQHGEYIDEPTDRNDHAMNTMKYLLSPQPQIASLMAVPSNTQPSYMKWHEYEEAKNPRGHRYGN